MPPSRNPIGFALCGAAVAFVLAVGGAPAADGPLASVDEAGWQGVLGVRPTVSVAQRHIVLLRGPSLAARVRAEGGSATEAQMRQWTAAAQGGQQQFLRRIAASGALVSAEHRYVRVLNGFSAPLDPNTLALLERDPEVAGIYPVRVAYPAQEDEDPALEASLPASAPDLRIPGVDGTGVVVALLDTGVDRSHPYLRDSVLPGIDVITRGSGGIAQPHPAIPGRPERHGTELAGIVTGSDGPSGLQGVAPGASILPVRVAGWQQDVEGGYAVYSRTDQVLAGLEAAVDPNSDGDAHDAARIALIGLAEPYAAFPDGPLARAIDGAAALDVLVVVPAGNDGAAGPAFGSVGGPGGAPAALTVAATDGRPSSPTVRIHVRAGLRVLFEGVVPLGGSPVDTVTADVMPVPRAVARRGLAGYFDEDGVSRTAGAAVLLPRGNISDEAVEEAARSGALAVLVDGPLPPGAFTLDVPTGVPVVGIPLDLARTVRTLRSSGIPVTVAVGAAGVAQNAGGGEVAPFSSQGLAFGGGLKPELLAPGVSIATSEPGRGEDGDVRYGTISGTSAAAAVAAGAAAVLAGARPGASALGVKGLLVGSARWPSGPSVTRAGSLDLRTALQQEAVVEPATVSFGPVSRGSVTLEQPIRIRNLSTRRMRVTISVSRKGENVDVEPVNDALSLGPGRSGEVVLRAEIGRLSEGVRMVAGELLVQPRRSRAVRLPWVLAVPDADVDLLSDVSLRETGDRVSDATPAVVSFVAGAIETEGGPQVRPVGMLDVQLWRGSDLVGVLSRRRELLPGRYAFGLTGRGPVGEPLRRGRYVVRLVARPDDGTRRQVESLDYLVR
jgi:subtilisin family serine protease